MEDDNPFTKAQTIDPEVRAYVYSLVNALGGTSGDENGRYVLGDDALAVLRDLKRWLKLYDEKTNRLDVARCLAEAKLVTGDLLPILASWQEGAKNDKLRSRTALACLELLVPLTWPLEHAEMTVNHHRHTPYIQQAQVLYKAGVLNWDNSTLLRQAIRVGLPSIAMKREERTNRDDGIIKLMLYFLRNIAVIRQIPSLPSQGLENEVSRSATIEAFRDQDVFALLLTMCSNMGEDFSLQDVIILEIIFNLIKGVDVEKLWMTEAQRKGQEVSDLRATLNDERSLHKDAKKSEPTRHGRFGTMIWLKREGDKMSAVSGQDNLRDGRTTLLNIDKSKKWNKPLQKRRDIDHTIYDFDRQTTISSSASEKLRNFVEEFLDSGFNPLMTHLRKAIEREADRILDINYRQFFYVVAWFLQAERVRRQKAKREEKPVNLTTDFSAESFGLVAAVLNQETFITINRYMQNSLDNKEWQDLNACMKCFTQILLTVQEMAVSPLEDDQEIAENIQNRIFYEETTHDRIVAILKGYKDQGFGYLDACTELSHVFLRMLERYSKENADLQIRSRRRAKQKRKSEAQKTKNQVGNGPDTNEEANESEHEDVVDIIQVSRERKFDFKRFAAKFTSQSSVNTYLAFTTYFKELSVDQLKRAHRFFYRVAFKQEMAVLLYRVDVVALFHKMIQGPEGLSRKHVMYAEYAEFSKQLFRKMFKKLEQRPELMVELLFSKINKTLYYLEHGHDKIAPVSTRAPAELEVKPAAGRDRSEQIGIVVTVLIKDEKESLVTWIKETLKKAFDERHAWETEAEARQATIEADAAKDGEDAISALPTSNPSYITVRPGGADVQTAMFKNSRLKLLMKLVGFEILGVEDALDTTWIVPAEVTSSELSVSVAAIEQYEATHWQSENIDDSPEDLLRRVRNQPVKEFEDSNGGLIEARRDAFIDDSEGDENPDLNEEFLFPDNIRQPNKKRSIMEELKARRAAKKRKRGSDDDEEGEDEEIDGELAAQRRKARQQAALERRRKIKSELYVRDSDDETDEERDREFFVQEEKNRLKHVEKIRQQVAAAQLEAEKANPTKTKKRRRKASSNENHERLDRDDTPMLDTSDNDAENTVSSSPSARRSSPVPSDSDKEAEETPLSSPHHSIDHTSLKELQQPRVSTVRDTRVGKDSINADIQLSDTSDDDDDDHNSSTNANPIATGAIVRRMRGGFVIESDDDEE